MAQAIAVWREASGHGESDAFPSEMPVRRAYDTVVVISRSGTTTEVLRQERVPVTADGSANGR